MAETAPSANELLLLSKACSDALNEMSDAFIKFSIAYVALKNKLENHDHPTLFTESENHE